MNFEKEILSLAESMRSRGFVKEAEELADKWFSYKSAEQEIYKMAEEGKDVVDRAHPAGEVEMIAAKDGFGNVETIVTQHDKIMEVVNKAPKNAELIINVIKMAELVLLADEQVVAEIMRHMGKVEAAKGRNFINGGEDYIGVYPIENVIERTEAELHAKGLTGKDFAHLFNRNFDLDVDKQLARLAAMPKDADFDSEFQAFMGGVAWKTRDEIEGLNSNMAKSAQQTNYEANKSWAPFEIAFPAMAPFIEAGRLGYEKYQEHQKQQETQEKKEQQQKQQTEVKKDVAGNKQEVQILKELYSNFADVANILKKFKSDKANKLRTKFASLASIAHKYLFDYEGANKDPNEYVYFNFISFRYDAAQWEPALGNYGIQEVLNWSRQMQSYYRNKATTTASITTTNDLKKTAEDPVEYDNKKNEEDYAQSHQNQPSADPGTVPADYTLDEGDKGSANKPTSGSGKSEQLPSSQAPQAAPVHTSVMDMQAALIDLAKALKGTAYESMATAIGNIGSKSGSPDGDWGPKTIDALTEAENLHAKVGPHGEALVLAADKPAALQEQAKRNAEILKQIKAAAIGAPGAGKAIEDKSYDWIIPNSPIKTTIDQTTGTELKLTNLGSLTNLLGFLEKNGNLEADVSNITFGKRFLTSDVDTVLRALHARAVAFYKIETAKKDKYSEYINLIVALYNDLREMISQKESEKKDTRFISEADLIATGLGNHSDAGAGHSKSQKAEDPNAIYTLSVTLADGHIEHVLYPFVGPDKTSINFSHPLWKGSKSMTHFRGLVLPLEVMQRATSEFLLSQFGRYNEESSPTDNVKNFLINLQNALFNAVQAFDQEMADKSGKLGDFNITLREKAIRTKEYWDNAIEDARVRFGKKPYVR